MDSLDNSPLGNVVAGHLAQVVREAQNRDCPDGEALSKIEGEIDQALKAFQQYELARS
jgi:hypothetical protein